MEFSFVAPPTAPNVNWSAQVIDNVLFQIEDFSASCFADRSDCKDVYSAKLVRIK
jgi:hypothetical protein